MSGSDDGNIGYWLLTNGQLYKSSNKGMNPAGAPVTALAVFPKIDGQPFRLVSGGGDGSVKIWNAAGQVQSTVMGGVRESRMMEANWRYVFDAKHIVLNTKS